ncbi:uncharacterized protein LOC120258412 [Dioscorea cayenensis subsp. rotundata]|uniref:Uncharacterized protein LOC120258412 n=1 Tax=Dioscorea cayennensis subsp. rotundata TaxID=55577 RepID=A0AB40B3A1_DIOCR|nr:uncharacterized protein LOC120258412 [Dioscorea cayenensis subsp. rotundata]XP_039121736.1 uncharacterized protein LOC120258412 [Dioscorea cayenensis subsp. rotundata]XP_039121737.1 uncharacterized protein LOC120258412 [Dioscorea cayenensis subsp. rotundata]XP_039121738.1 uncharacterized protein LOC120258412 [Dioscorea cayenensis subsp. rotundata]XP_039121739.1 uncharacterized protein LOC120258412 [Dioscorea cayenensis subsp. rotundata]XP_039121740.1 uncharacterized protein LOC120258412 [Di
MATANNASSSTATVEDAAVRAASKRYEGLMMVRTKAIKGKGAWYWAHLEPILVRNTDTGLAKAVKLRCLLCDALFSASNPSRTASEHLKRGTCPNFSSSPSPHPRPISSIAPPPNSRKRSPPFHVSPLALVDPSSYSSTPPPPPPPPPPPQQQLVLSGGKEDLSALEMFEASVKRLKSPKASPGPALSKPQIDTAMALLADWVHESCGAVSLSALSHPKFRSFLHQVGLPPISPRDLTGPLLDSRFDEARLDSDARLRDALFFQLASHGWKPPFPAADPVVSLTANLPNGTTLFCNTVFVHNPRVPSKYAEEILWDAVTGLCAGGLEQRCVGIIADRFKNKALRELENRKQWMINIPCQLQALRSLLKDFARELPLFHSAAANCSKLASFFNSESQVRVLFHKYQLQELDHSGLLRVPPRQSESSHDFDPIFAMFEDVMGNARPLQSVVHDENYKLACAEDSTARELSEMIRDVRLWNELEAVLSLVKVVKSMAAELETERPLLGQCLPLWDDLRSKVKQWCSKFSIDHGVADKVIEKRFKKNYHPAWSAAFILDPLYLIKDASGKYLPPFKCLTSEQEKDVDKLITRLVSPEEAHIALMELMKWRSEGLDPLYAQAVQMKQPDPMTGKMRIANPTSSRLVWETCLSEFKSLGKVAVRLIFLHCTSCSFKSNPSLLRLATTHAPPASRTAIDRIQKMIFVAAHSKLERRDFSSEEDKDAELFASEREDDVLNEAFMDV